MSLAVMTQIPWHIEGETLGRQWRVTLLGLLLIGLLRFAAHAHSDPPRIAWHEQLRQEWSYGRPGDYARTCCLQSDAPRYHSQAPEGNPYAPHKPKS
jgi:hypothetical protein